MQPAGWSVLEYRGRGALERLAADWKRLYSEMPLRTSAHAFEAHLAYFELLMAAPDRFRCLALADGQEVRAVCPLEATVDHILGPPVAVWSVPRLPHMRIQDVICPEDEARRELLPAIVDYLRKNPEGRRLLVLGPLSEDSVIWAGAEHLDPETRCVRPTEPSDVFDCTMSFDELMSRLSKHFRRNLRSHRNKLSSLPDLRFVRATQTRDLVRELESFMQVEASGWKGAGGTRLAVQLRPKHPAFYTTLGTTLGGGASSDRCEINALYADGRCIASQYCARTGAQYVIHKIGYDETYRRLAPGLTLLERTLERCCEDPTIERLSLLTDGPWQRDWHPDVMPLRQEYFALGRWSGGPLTSMLSFRLGRGGDFVRRSRTWSRRARSAFDGAAASAS
jgi:Acetyltransferase (GNAT) domain